MKLKSTKKFKNFPCSHAQYFHKDVYGNPGECASLHGYSRNVEFTFAGEPDKNGWIVPFGKLKRVKEFLEYYFDHTTILGADDPRIITRDIEKNPLFNTLRILPSGVSMEMSSLFVWEHVNHYINYSTDGRCYVQKVQMWENEYNSAFVEVDEKIAKNDALTKQRNNHSRLNMKPKWQYESPEIALSRIKG